MKSHYHIAIVGAGAGGIMTAAQLKKERPDWKITIVDPSSFHHYQPAYTLVGAGTFDMKETQRPTKDIIPRGVNWIKDSVTIIHPEENRLTTASSGDLSYDFLVLSPGVIYDYDAIPGLREAMEKGIVCSNYTDPELTWRNVSTLNKGRAIFTAPATPIKCGRAPQKAAYISSDYWRKNGQLGDIEVLMPLPGSVLFGVTQIRETLEKVVERYGIHFIPKMIPILIDAQHQTVTFSFSGTDEEWEAVKLNPEFKEASFREKEFTLHFDFLHLAPPQRAPYFLTESGLTNAQGWIDVDQYTLQHNNYKNIFAIGDAAALPTAKTGAAIRKQVPVVLSHLIELERSGNISAKRYDGYSSCPLVTAYGKMVLAEFNYKNEFTPDPKLKFMLIFKSYKERWMLWILKKYILPFLYWTRMMKGKQV